jgi:hypothetical protein
MKEAVEVLKDVLVTGAMKKDAQITSKEKRSAYIYKLTQQVR